MTSVRAVEFFDASILDHAIFKDLYFTCVAAGAGILAFGKSDGRVLLLNRSYEPTELTAFDGSVLHIRIAASDPPILLVVGDDVQGAPESVRLFRLPITPDCVPVKEITIFTAKYPPPVRRILPSAALSPSEPPAMSAISSLALSPALDVLAVGLTSGDVAIFRSDLLQDKNPRPFIDRRTRNNARPVDYIYTYRSAVCAVSNDVAYTYVRGPTDELRSQRLFRTQPGLVTALGVTCAEVGLEGGSDLPLLAADRGGLRSGSDEVVAVDCDVTSANALFSYKGVVGVALPRMDSPGDEQLLLYDLTLGPAIRTSKRSVSGRVAAMHGVWGSLYVFCQLPTGELEVHKLVEKDSHSKLLDLLGFGLFSLARAVATSRKHSKDAIIDVNRREGLQLLDQGRVEEAIEVFLHPLGPLPPSEVIRRFLGDPLNAQHLPTYLIELHARDVGASDAHCRLLLHMLAKLGKADVLASFLLDPRNVGGSTYDVDAALRVCRQAQFFAVAGAVADVHDRVSVVASILVNDMGAYKDALSYIRGLPLRLAEDLLVEHGRVLVERVPAATTLLLQQIVTHWAPAPRLRPPSIVPDGILLPPPAPFPASAGGEAATPASNAALPSRFVLLFGRRLRSLLRFLECVVHNRAHLREDAAAQSFIHTTLLEVYVSTKLHIPPFPAAAPLLLSPSDTRGAMDTSSVGGLSATDTPSSDADAEEELSEVAIAALDTHLDMRERRAKALALLTEQGMSLDWDAALVACQAAGFTDGVLAIYERRGLHKLALQLHMDRNDVAACIATARTLCPRDPHVWTSVLAFLVASPSATENHIADALAHLRDHDTLPPADVVRLLAANHKVSIGTAHDFLMHAVTAQLAMVEDLTAVRDRLADTYDSFREQAAVAKSVPQVVQTERCTHCGSALQPPLVTFLCKHSYHVSCLGDKHKCMECAPRHAAAMELAQGEDADGRRLSAVGEIEDLLKVHSDPFVAVTGLLVLVLLYIINITWEVRSSLCGPVTSFDSFLPALQSI